MVEQSCVFISDVHLGAFSVEKEAEVEHDLLSLIEYCTEQRLKIYILGDLFDYWMEYPQKNYIPTVGASVLEAFKKHNKTIGAVTFIMGNHDNWNFGYFEKLGFDVESNFRIIHLNENKILLMHGDGRFINADKLIRPLFHRILRSSSFIRFYQAVFPPSIGINLMKKFSGMSKLSVRTNTASLNAHAKEILAKKDIDVILMGHDHVPRMETFSHRTYINLGTFYYHKTLALYTNNEFDLVRWSGSTKEFVPFTEFKTAT